MIKLIVIIVTVYLHDLKKYLIINILCKYETFTNYSCPPGQGQLSDTQLALSWSLSQLVGNCYKQI